MALVDSLLTAMVRANGDALVMHVGERPYVVRASGTIDLSTHGLNLDAMTGMLAQLLPADAKHALHEFGAVEHQLPSIDDDRFTVVAAQGGDDIWIEIRRRRTLPEVAAVAAGGGPALRYEAPLSDQGEHSEAVPAREPLPAPHEHTTLAEPVVLAEASAHVEAIPQPEPVAIPEPEELAGPVANVEPVPAVESEVSAEPAASAQPTAPIETVEIVEPVPAAVFESALIAEPIAPIETLPIAERVAEIEPEAMPEPVMIAGPIVSTEVETIAQPFAAAEATDNRGAGADGVTNPSPVAEVAVAVQQDEMPPISVVAEAPSIAAPELVEMATAPVVMSSQSAAPTPIESPGVELQAIEPLESALTDAESPAGIEFVPQPLHAVDSVVLPMTRTTRVEVPQLMPSSRTAGVERLLRLAAARGASSLYLTSESRPYLRVEGDIRILEDESVLTKADVEAAALEIGPEGAQELVRKREATEWIAELPELGRIRCTSFQDHHGPGVLFRMIATRAATAEQLGLSREVQTLATEAEGLVLVAGPRASGKTTLMSALVDLINRQRADHVITLERQIRLVHDNRTALVSQREIRGGADEALSAARAALRENPDVLVVDDLSSAHMVPLLLEAAGQGLLVLVSITAPATAAAVERFVDMAPPESRAAVQAAMSETFRGAVAQVLLKKTGGGRVTAREVLLGTASVTRLIAQGQLSQLPLALESGRKHGMMPMTDALLSYVQSGAVDAREAFRKAQDRDRFVAGLKRAGIDTSAVERLA